MVMPNVARAGLPEHWRTMRCEPKGITGFAGDGVNRFRVMPVFSVSVAGSGGKCSLMVGWIRGDRLPGMGDWALVLSGIRWCGTSQGGGMR